MSRVLFTTQRSCFLAGNPKIMGVGLRDNSTDLEVSITGPSLSRASDASDGILSVTNTTYVSCQSYEI